jgi:hypothetical protein
MTAGANRPIDNLVEPIDEAFEPASRADIRKIEELVRAPLPPTYDSFLAQIGSCMFAGEATVKASNGEVLGIATFFGGRPSRNVLDDLRVHEDYVAKQLVPIADTFLNDRYVLDLSTGKVHYIEYHAGTNRVIEVAPSFDDFLTRISVDSDAL